MMRTKGEAGTGDVVEAVRHARSVNGEIRRHQLHARGRTLYLRQRDSRALPPGQGNCRARSPSRVNFAAGGVATPADAALMMQLGVDGVFCRKWDLQKRQSR